jgi:hypothetical protein
MAKVVKGDPNMQGEGMLAGGGETLSSSDSFPHLLTLPLLVMSLLLSLLLLALLGAAAAADCFMRTCCA